MFVRFCMDSSLRAIKKSRLRKAASEIEPAQKSADRSRRFLPTEKNERARYAAGLLTQESSARAAFPIAQWQKARRPLYSSGGLFRIRTGFPFKIMQMITASPNMSLSSVIIKPNGAACQESRTVKFMILSNYGLTAWKCSDII